MVTTLSLPAPKPLHDRQGIAVSGKLAAALVFFFLLFWYGGPALQQADPAAAVADPGVLSLVLLALLCLLTFTALSFWLLGLLWPVLNDYRKYHFQKNFKMLLPWQKLLFYLSAFFLLLFAFVCCLLAVL